MKRSLRFVTSVVLFTLACLPAIAADLAAAAAASPQAKVYETHLQAMMKADYAGFRATMSKTALAQMDKQNKDMNLDPKKMMEMMKAMAPTDLKFTDVKIDGKKAALMATGKMGGEANWGTISLVDEGGQWKIETESWTNTKK